MTPEPEDADGYPADSTLEALRVWPITDGGGALDFLQAAWHGPEMARTDFLTAHEGYVVHDDGGRYLRVTTGGWSGNEDLLGEFELSQAYMVTWQLSARGGLHIFKYPAPADRTARP